MIRLVVCALAMAGTWGLTFFLPGPFHTPITYLWNHALTMAHILVVIAGGVAYKITR